MERQTFRDEKVQPPQVEAKTSEDQNESNLKTNQELKQKRQLQKQYTGNWVWRAVSALIDTTDFKPSPQWIAQKLNATINEVVSALDGLEQLGIIRRTESGYEKVLKFIYYSDRDLDPRSVLSDHVLISTQILGRLDPLDPQNNSFYRTGFVASNRALAKKYSRKLEDLMRDFLEESNQAEADSVYAFSFSILDVT